MRFTKITFFLFFLYIYICKLLSIAPPKKNCSTNQPTWQMAKMPLMQLLHQSTCSAALRHHMAESFIYKYSWQLRHGARCSHMSDVHLQNETFCCPERTCCDTDQGSVTRSISSGEWKALNKGLFDWQKTKQNHSLKKSRNHIWFHFPIDLTLY